MQIQIQIHNCKLLFYIQTQLTNIHFTWMCALCSPGYNATQLPAFGCGIEAVERTLRTFFLPFGHFFGPCGQFVGPFGHSFGHSFGHFFDIFFTFWRFLDLLDIFGSFGHFLDLADLASMQRSSYDTQSFSNKYTQPPESP